MYLYLILIGTILLNAAANILIKAGMRQSPENNFSLWNAVLNPGVIAGAICFGLSFLLYCYILSKMHLSIAYPIITSACFLLVVFFSYLLFKEKLLLIQIIGFLLIIVGIWFVAKGV